MNDDQLREARGGVAKVLSDLEAMLAPVNPSRGASVILICFVSGSCRSEQVNVPIVASEHGMPG